MKTIDANLVLGRPATHSSGVLASAELIAEMDRREVEKGLVAHLAGTIHEIGEGNDLLLREMRGSRDGRGRLVPVPAVDPNAPDGSLDWEAWDELGARGVRAASSLSGPGSDARAKAALLARLADRGWFLEVAIRPFCGSQWQTGSVAEAAALAGMAEELTVVVICPARQQFAELVPAMESQPNLWADVGNLSTGTAVRDLVGRCFTDRLVCGSGFGISYSTTGRDIVRYSPIPEAAVEAILRGNGERLISKE